MLDLRNRASQFISGAGSATQVCRASGNFTREGMSVFNEHIWLLPDDLEEENKLYRFSLNELLKVGRESLREQN
jgi:hypothetical protein